MSAAGIGYAGTKLILDLVKKIKRGDYSKHPSYVERASDQIGYKKQGKAKMPYKRAGKKRAAYGRKTTKKKTYKRKRTATKRPVRKSAKKKRKVSKTVSLTVGTSRTRFVSHEKYSVADAMYVPLSSIGPKNKMLKSVSQALLLHYMHRVGDYRASASVVPSVAVPAAQHVTTTWSRMRFTFLSYTSVDSSIDVYSVVGGTAQTLEELTNTLASALIGRLKLNTRLATVCVYRDTQRTTGNTGDDVPVLQDIQAGRNHIEFSSKALMKMQNTTPADATHTGAETCGHDNMLNMNRNPIDGLVYKFRNAVPKFQKMYLLSRTPAQRQIVDAVQDIYTGSVHGVSVVSSNTCLPFAANDDVFKIPPPAPSTIFANSAGKSSVFIDTGSHKTFGLTEYHKGPVNGFFDRFFGVDEQDVPPGGTSIIVGLKPKYRNDSQAAIRVECEVDLVYAARVSRAKLTALPMETTLD